MYIVFMVLTPIARKVAKRWSWDRVVYISLAIWVGAQLGIRHWLYVHIDIPGLSVPENSTGAFDMYGWQFLWMVGLALGSIYADSIAAPPQPNSGGSGMGIPKWLFRLSVGVATAFLILRYSPADRWIDPNLYGWLIDKWHLGPARLINFSALAIVLVRCGTRIAALPFMTPLAALGQASIEVFCVHVLCCLCGDALSRQADPNLPWWQQVVLLVFTISALFLTAQVQRKRAGKKRSEVKVASS
jgi:hypothetical protein